MRYKPKCCGECGAKIQSESQKLWNIRRFCENCVLDQKQHVILPKIGAAVLVLFGLFGIGNSLQKADKPLNINKSQFIGASLGTERREPETVRTPPAPQTPQADEKSLPNEKTASNQAEIIRRASQTPVAPVKTETAEADEAVYYCGARTKKGTACTRRVKGGGRCWQHTGQPAFAAPEKNGAEKQ